MDPSVVSASTELRLTVNIRHIFFLSMSIYMALSVLPVCVLLLIGLVYPIGGIACYAILGYGLLSRGGSKYRKVIVEQFVLFKAVLSGGLVLTSFLFVIFSFHGYRVYLVEVISFAVFAEVVAVIGYVFKKHGESIEDLDMGENSSSSPNPSRHCKLLGLSVDVPTFRKPVFVGSLFFNTIISVLLLMHVPPLAAYSFYYGSMYNGLLFAIPRFPSKKHTFVGGALFYNAIVSSCLAMAGVGFLVTAFDQREYFFHLRDNVVVGLACLVFAAIAAQIAWFLHRYFWFLKQEGDDTSKQHYNRNLVTVAASQLNRLENKLKKEAKQHFDTVGSLTVAKKIAQVI